MNILFSFVQSLVLCLLELSLFTNVISLKILSPQSQIYFRYRNNDISSEMQGVGGRGLERQQLNRFINTYLIKQILNKFSEVFVKQMVY